MAQRGYAKARHGRARAYHPRYFHSPFSSLPCPACCDPPRGVSDKLPAGAGAFSLFLFLFFFLTTSFDFYRRNIQWLRLRRAFLWADGKLQIEWTIIISRSESQNMRRVGRVLNRCADGLLGVIVIRGSYARFFFVLCCLTAIRCDASLGRDGKVYRSCSCSRWVADRARVTADTIARPVLSYIRYRS